MTQQSIDFDRLARTSDPPTSHEAAVETAAKLGRLHRCVLEAAQRFQDFTARECAELAASMFGGEVESYRKRAGELERAGRIREHSIRACRITGKPARAFVLTEER